MNASESYNSFYILYISFILGLNNTTEPLEDYILSWKVLVNPALSPTLFRKYCKREKGIDTTTVLLSRDVEQRLCRQMAEHLGWNVAFSFSGKQGMDLRLFLDLVEYEILTR